MGKKAKAKQAIEPPLDRERTREADYYARKVGMTRDEALRIIREADPAKLSTVPNGNAKRK
ncbi:hypothetical protein [Mesorhizobium sp.]|uniref:hypothetical protein n=1 Tax=Mesorhizobium sp. TaxID=1871066 RepID=UPI000FE80396|nr:hypothetical protein [Mesorhizobium sp.]RWA69063.1 MAG: hypothetical protein EOQ29_17880 [Mesorhizobium sp.]